MTENTSLMPAFTANNCAAFFGTDEGYVPYLGVTLVSIIKNSKPQNNYDLLVLEADVSAASKEKLLSLAEGKPNISLRFLAVAEAMTPIIKTLDLERDKAPLATYYRLLAPSLFKNYEKIIYLDADLVVLADLAELFNLDLQDQLAAASTDFFAVKDLESGSSSAKRWLAELELSEPQKYFNAGVMLFNLRKMREENCEAQYLARLQKVRAPRLHDQDVLNFICQGRTKYLDPAWNSQGWFEDAEESTLPGSIPAELVREYERTKAAPKIIHYLSWQKPWHLAHLPLADHFWQYAAMTPFYHDIVLKNLRQRNRECEVFKKVLRSPNRKFLKLRYSILGALATGERKRRYAQKLERLKRLEEDLKSILYRVI